jgi:predicted nucleotidyltransferase
MINLLPHHSVIIKAILKIYVPQREVWVFGSRVTSKIKPHSDIDLAIIGNEPLTPKEMSALREAFDESSLPFQVDLVDWATTDQEFRSIIQSKHEIIQSIV